MGVPRDAHYLGFLAWCGWDVVVHYPRFTQSYSWLPIDFKGCWVSQRPLGGTWVPLSVEHMSQAVCLEHVAAYDAGFRSGSNDHCNMVLKGDFCYILRCFFLCDPTVTGILP